MRIMDETNTLYEMANFGTNTTGEPFTIWIDEAGKDRKTKHDLPRFKVEKGNIHLDIVIEPDGTVRFDRQNTSKLHKFGPYKDALKFVEKFKPALLMHWNKKIETGDLALIMKLVSKKKYSVEDAIEATLNDDF